MTSRFSALSVSRVCHVTAPSSSPVRRLLHSVIITRTVVHSCQKNFVLRSNCDLRFQGLLARRVWMRRFSDSAGEGGQLLTKPKSMKKKKKKKEEMKINVNSNNDEQSSLSKKQPKIPRWKRETIIIDQTIGNNIESNDTWNHNKNKNNNNKKTGSNGIKVDLHPESSLSMNIINNNNKIEQQRSMEMNKQTNPTNQRGKKMASFSQLLEMDDEPEPKAPSLSISDRTYDSATQYAILSDEEYESDYDSSLETDSTDEEDIPSDPIDAMQRSISWRDMFIGMLAPIFIVLITYQGSWILSYFDEALFNPEFVYHDWKKEETNEMNDEMNDE